MRKLLVCSLFFLLMLDIPTLRAQETVSGGRLLFSLPVEGEGIQSTWSADGSRLLIVTVAPLNCIENCLSYLHIRDAATSEILQVVEENGRITRAIWSPDDQSVLVYLRNDVRLHMWNASTGERIFTLVNDYPEQPNGDRFWWFRFNADGSRILTTTVVSQQDDPSTFAEVQMESWDARSGELLTKLRLNEGQSGTWSRSGHYIWLTCSSDYCTERYVASLWAVESEERTITVQSSLDYTNAVWNPDESLIAICNRFSPLYIYDITTGGVLRTIDVSILPGCVVRWSGDSSKILFSHSSYPVEYEITIFNVITGQVEFTGEGGNYGLHDWSPDQSMMVISSYDKVVLWNLITGQILSEITIDRLSNTSSLVPEFSPLSNYILLTNTDSNMISVSVWDFEANKLFTLPKQFERYMYWQTWSATEELLYFRSSSPAGNSTLRYSLEVWDIQNQSLVQAWEAVAYMEWHPVDSRLLISLDSEIQIWDFAVSD